jgi:hypothetical protein
MLKGSQAVLPSNGKILDHLKANDHIICDVTSHDLWVKFKLIIVSPDKSLESELEMKIDKEMKG